jgi:hypothetical protein
MEVCWQCRYCPFRRGFDSIKASHLIGVPHEDVERVVNVKAAALLVEPLLVLWVAVPESARAQYAVRLAGGALRDDGGVEAE